MSAHAGVMWLDGRPARPSDLASVPAALMDWGPDWNRTCSQDAVSMVHCMLAIHPEDLATAQPYASTAGFVIAFDGQLHNREDLLVRCGHDLQPRAADVVIVGAIYERYGVDGLRFLVGDWSLAIWSSRERCLTLACDYLGARPLYYAQAIDHVSWSTSLGELAEREGKTDVINDRYVIAKLAGLSVEGATPYQGIAMLEPGQAVSVTPRQGLQRRNIWTFDPGSIRYRRPEEYEERFRELFGRAVLARLQTDRPVLSDLSGGLDSSAVACMADHWIKRGGCTAPELATFSGTSDTSEDLNESRFVEAVESQLGRRSFRCDVYAADSICDDEPWVEPRYLHGAQMMALRHLLTLGGRVWLTGHFGDRVTWNAREDVTSVIERNPERSLWDRCRELRQWCRTARLPMVQALGELFPLMILPAGSLASRMMRTRFFVRQWPRLIIRDQGTLDSICDCVRHRVEAALRWPDPSKIDLKLSLALAGMTRPFTPKAAMRPIYWTHPFSDRRLVEYVLAIPSSVLVRPGEPRALMKRALAPIWPPSIGARQSKGPGSVYAIRKLRRNAETLTQNCEHMNVVLREYVSLESLRLVITRAVRGDAQATAQLSLIQTVEHWLAAKTQRAHAHQSHDLYVNTARFTLERSKGKEVKRDVRQAGIVARERCASGDS